MLATDGEGIDSLETAEHYMGFGFQWPPAETISREVCTVIPGAGHSLDDVLRGWTTNKTDGWLPVGPSNTTLENSAGSIKCFGYALGLRVQPRGLSLLSKNTTLDPHVVNELAKLYQPVPGTD